MSDQDNVCIAMTTVPDRRTAERIATTIVEERLGACVNILDGVVSIYRWKGTMHREPEVLMLIKTTTAAFSALSKRIESLHPYEVPELLQLPVDTGLTAYMEWVTGAVSGD